MKEAGFSRGLEREGADALLDAGVSVPLCELHLPFVKKTWHLRVTMKRPRLGGMMAIAREWLKTGTTAKQMWEFSKEEEMKFLSEHGAEVSRMIAWTVCRGAIARRWLVRPVAWCVREWMEPKYMLSAVKHYVQLLSVDPFLVIIASAEAVNPMKLRTSHERKGS